MRAALGWVLPLRGTSHARTAATSRWATVRWAGSAPQCGSRCSGPGACSPRTPTRGEGTSKPLLRPQALEFFRVLDVELEAAGHQDVAGFLIGLAGPHPL